MTNPLHYFTFSFKDKSTKEYVGWNTTVATTEEEAIVKAQQQWDTAESTYYIDTASFIQQTDEEMVEMVNFAL
jgi:hypothetical protein